MYFFHSKNNNENNLINYFRYIGQSFDHLTYAVVIALEELVETSDKPNTRMFAWLFSKHLRAAYTSAL